ncbi:MAG: xanthine dehydrogenase family protein molybdopterin-binding subunit [Chloroflexi bacterium]|nr:xanthine dehydrogenase family protein molybdopterin-binding subunit [Chloroflexota bacterium]
MSAEASAVISQSVKRIDARGKVTGETRYPGDIDIAGQLWMRVKFSERAHARVLRVDASRAEALPGVVRIFTSQDVPVNEYGLVIKDQPVLCGPGGDKPGTDVVRCYMDMVATVVAESDAIAREALDLIEVTYEDLPAVFDAEAAMEKGAPQLHPESPGNLVTQYRIRRGDMAAGWARADVVVEAEYETTWQEHAYLQPEAGLSYIDDEDRVTVVVAGQWTHEDQEQIYHALDLPPEQVRVIYPAIGGAFGGREDMTVQIILALAAWKLRQPVKIQWNREESILYHHKRHPIKVRAKWGATSGGVLTAAAATVIGDAGAYNYTSNKVLGNAQLTVTGPYEIANAHVDTYAVYTNNIPSGAFRGFGAPQALLAAEGQMNRLAAALNMDPLEIRMKNTIREGSIGSVGTPFPAGVTMPQVFAACGKASWWHQRDQGWRMRAASQPADSSKRRGRGIAGGFKNVGFSFGFPEHCWAGLELQGEGEIESVTLYHAGADVGQGAHTALCQMVAEAVGVAFEKVRIVASDTATSGSSGSASASRLSFMSGNAIRGAAEFALRKWHDEERPAKGEYMYHPPPTTAFDPETGECDPNFAYGYVAEAVEVEVDIETGQVQLLEVVCANDVGKVINPQQLEGQIEGAIVQAQGYALMEYLVSREGKLLNPYLSTYLIPTSLDVPPVVKSVVLEHPDPIGPWGARGMAEMPFLPLAPAIAAAIYDATGVWMDSQPFTAQKVVKALRRRGIGAV